MGLIMLPLQGVGNYFEIHIGCCPMLRYVWLSANIPNFILNCKFRSVDICKTTLKERK